MDKVEIVKDEGLSLHEKIRIINENKDVAVAAINMYLDRIYNLTDGLYDENGNFVDVEIATDVRDFADGLRDDATQYETIRKKIIQDKADKLTLFEVNLCALAFFYVETVWKKQIDSLTTARKDLSEITSQLLAKKEKLNI